MSLGDHTLNYENLKMPIEMNVFTVYPLRTTDRIPTRIPIITLPNIPISRVVRELGENYPHSLLSGNVPISTASGFFDTPRIIPNIPDPSNGIQRVHPLRHQDLKLVSINVTSINTRQGLAKIDLQLHSGNFDIACIQETSFDPNLPKDRWTINGYTRMTSDDKKCSNDINVGKNGGTAIYVKNELVQFCKVLPFPHSFKMAQICGIKFDGLHIINVYRSPNQVKVDKEEPLLFAQYLQEILPKRDLFLFGDFNLAGENWNDKHTRKPDQKVFVKMFNNLNLNQHITDATNPLSGNVLDLFLSYDNSKIKDSYVDYSWTRFTNDEWKPIFQHWPVIVTFSSRPDYTTFEMVKDYYNVDEVKFRKLFKERKTGMNMEHYCAHFKIVREGLLRECICGILNCPKDLQCICGEKHDLTEEIESRHKELAKNVTECYEQATPMKKVFHYTESKNRFSYKTLKQKKRIDNLKRNGNTTGLIQEQLLLEEYINDDMEQETKNMISFWSKHRNNVYQTIKRTKKMSTKNEGIYKDVDNNDKTLVYDDKEKVSILVEHSRKVLKNTNAYELDWDKVMHKEDSAPFPSRHWQPSIDQDLIEYYIEHRIKDKHSIGSCGTSSHMIKILFDLISKPLTRLYRLMYITKYSPLDHRTSKIVFIPKKADNQADPNNKRGLNVVSPLYLPFEYLMCANQYQQMEKAGLFHDMQFGMRQTRNTEQNLMFFHDFLTKTEVNCDGQVLIFTDYSKAFDVVDHGVLMMEMNKNRFHPEVGKFFQFWFGNSHQFVQINQERSHTIPVKSSCKQGSIIAGMLAFNLVINDLFEYMKKKAKELGLEHQFYITSYCDDTKMAITIQKNKSFQAQLDAIQELLDHFIQWTVQKKLILNENKCVCILRHMNKKVREKVKFRFGDGELRIVESEVDLGVTTTRIPNGLAHIKKQTGAASKVIDSIRHIIPRITYDTQLMLWNSLIRSVCLYGSHCQFPFLKSERNRLRRVFRNFWKLCAKPNVTKKRPITVLQFMVLKDLIWWKKSIHLEFPHTFDMDLTEIKLTHERRTSSRTYGNNFPENGTEAMAFSIQRLKKRRKESMRYRHLQLFQSIPLEIIQTEDMLEFKNYCIENVLPSYDSEDMKMVNDLFDGTLRINYFRQLKKRFELQKQKRENEQKLNGDSESDSSDDEDDV